jgi:2-oxoglutarate ferredoxin oxidoreductase subunit beta
MNTSTTPGGRSPERQEGYPILVCELLSQLRAVAYLERVTVSGPARVRRAKKALLHALETQEQRKGFSLVEILSPCPTYWRMPPDRAMQWIEETMTEVFPPGVYKDWAEA